MFETILGIVSAIGTVTTTGNALMDLVNKVKKHISGQEGAGVAPVQGGQPINYAPSSMPPFQSQMSNPHGQGNQWLPNLQALAREHGNPWVPQSTQPLLGINLTGIWVPPGSPYDQTFIRQYGPYLNVIAGIGGTPTRFAEGLFDPGNRIIHVVGRDVYGAPFESRGQLLPNWFIQGWIMSVGPFGQPMQAPLMMGKVA